jgi:pyruvate dehydrogenase E1 component alpha subunit
MPFTPERLQDAYRQMLVIRKFEETIRSLYQQGKIRGSFHPCVGQEATAVGGCWAVRKDDYMTCTYRGHGQAIAKGLSVRAAMAEMLGKVTGCSKGKGGSMHMFSREKSFYGGHGIVGAQVPIGTGLAFAHKYNGNKNVSLTYFGDGAANQGQVYESFNMAKLWKLPVIYVVENNQYAMGTSVERSSSETHLHKRGVSFNIPGEQVDGMDVLAVRAAADKAVKHCREGNGPIILEMKTYRYRGHSMSDPAKYRTREEVDQFREKRDPIDHLRSVIVEGKHATEEELKELDKEIRAIVNHAAEFAQTSPEPDPAELWTEIVH